MTAANLVDLEEHFDHLGSAHSANSLERFRVLRERCPVTHSDQHGGFWVVSKYATVMKILRQPEIFVSSDGVTIPPLPIPMRAIPTESDPPEHTEYRAVFMPFLTPGAVARYETMIRQRATALIDSFIGDGRADFMAKFARRLPAQAIAGFFGIGPDEGERCYGWLSNFMNPPGGSSEAAAEAVMGLTEFISAVLSRARAKPGNDLISAMVTHTTKAGTPFSDEQCTALLMTSIAGAMETTVSALASTVALLDRFPAARAELINDPSLAPRAVEEVLRMESPVHCVARTVRSDVTLDGIRFRQGDRVLLLFGSGNYDDNKYTDPEEFTLHRDHNPHLAFGHGIHRCVGAPLATLELRIALEEILARLPDFRVVSKCAPTVHARGTWGLSTLEIEFTPGPLSGE